VFNEHQTYFKNDLPRWQLDTKNQSSTCTFLPCLHLRMTEQVKVVGQTLSIGLISKRQRFPVLEVRIVALNQIQF
jgi:hypothetical protein